MDVSFSRQRRMPVALIASVTLNVVLLAVLLWPEGEPGEAASAAVDAATAAPQVAAPAQVEPHEDIPTAPIEPEELVEERVEEQAAKPTADASGVRTTIASVEGSIPQTLATAADPYGDALSATLSRLVVWDLDLRRDLRAGDGIEVSWTVDPSDVVTVEAARFHSQKAKQTITAYRFQASGDPYPSYWSEDGTEVPHTLRHSPLRTYEQITSLLKDRPNHHGMDFMVPVGTPIYASYDGVVTRVNWNTAANGGCVEVKHADGTLAKYLHLSESKVKAGDRVKRGDVLALTGNTGRSTGPHLHYQLNQGSRVVDPVDYHGSDRRVLPEGDREAFARVVANANARLDAARP